MITVDAGTPAGPEVLWSVVADVTEWPRFVPTFESVVLDPAGPSTGVGARFRVRQPGLAEAPYEVTEWQPGRSFTWVGRAPGVTTTAVHAVTADGTGAILRLSVAWSGPLAPLVRLLLSSRGRRMIATEAAALTDTATARARRA